MRLVMVPGLGDNVAGFRLVLPIWRALKFDASVYSFNWGHDEGEQAFATRFEQYVDYLDQQQPPIALLGASAGGVVAANALFARPTRVWRAAAIASPLWRSQHGMHGLLNGAIKRLTPQLALADEPIRQRLGTFSGRQDQKVPYNDSHVLGAYNRIIAAHTHNQAIAAALTLHAFEIAVWLRSGRGVPDDEREQPVALP